MLDTKMKEYVLFQLHRKITNLAKNFLVTLEDTRDDINNSPDVLYARGRKKVLDQTNDLLREISEDFKKIDVILKN
jgi:hypothetical protein